MYITLLHVTFHENNRGAVPSVIYVLTCLGPDPNCRPGVSGTMQTTCVTMHTEQDKQNVFLSTTWPSGGSSMHFHLQYSMYIYINMDIYGETI